MSKNSTTPESTIVFVGRIPHKICSRYLSTGNSHTCLACQRIVRGIYLAKPIIGDEPATVCRDCVRR